MAWFPLFVLDVSRGGSWTGFPTVPMRQSWMGCLNEGQNKPPGHTLAAKSLVPGAAAISVFRVVDQGLVLRWPDHAAAPVFFMLPLP